MEEKTTTEIKEEDYPKVITPWYLLTLLKPIIKDEIVAQFRFDRTGIRMKFVNGQKFHLTINEIT